MIISPPYISAKSAAKYLLFSLILPDISVAQFAGKSLKTQSEPHQCKIFVKLPPKVCGDGSGRSTREKKQSLSTGSYEVPSGFDEIVNVATIY